MLSNRGSGSDNPIAEIATPMLLRGAMKGTRYGKKKLQKRIRNSAISEAFRATETEFHRTFQAELQRVAKAQDSTELEAISLIWDSIAEGIGQEHLATADTETAIEKLIEAIENAVDIELKETDEGELKAIINKSYQNSIRKFRTEIAGTELADELHAEFGLSILNSLDELQEELAHIQDQATPFKPYDIFDTPVDKQEFLQILSIDSQLSYIDHKNVVNRELGRTLIVGMAGSGKTRAMYQMLSSELPVSHVVIPRRALSFAQDVQSLSYETFDGDVLLVWDNIHRISESGSNEAFEAAIHRLENNLFDQGHTLYVLATARSEDLDKVPGDVANRQGMWKNYDVIELDEWQRDDLIRLIDDAAAIYNVEIADAAYEGLVQKASGSAAPMYITVLFNQYTGDRFSSQDLMNLPDSIRQLWSHYHAKLLKESEDELVVLEACKLLFDVSLEPILTLTEGIYREVLGKTKRSFRPAINSLRTRGWLQIGGGKDSIGPEIIQIHDTQIQSIDIRISDYFSEMISFLQDDFDRYIPSVRGVPKSEVLALLQAETAIGLDVQGADAEGVAELFESALSHQPTHPIILNRYAQFISPIDPGRAESLLRQAIEVGVGRNMSTIATASFSGISESTMQL